MCLAVCVLYFSLFGEFVFTIKPKRGAFSVENGFIFFVKQESNCFLLVTQTHLGVFLWVFGPGFVFVFASLCLTVLGSATQALQI